MNGYFLCSVIVMCLTCIHIVDEILEQRRRETRTGEFEKQEDEE